MPTLKMVAQVLLLLALTSCAADPAPGTWTRGTAKACDSCTSDLDCAAGLLCDQDAFACKSVEQLKFQKSNGGQPVCEADCWQQCLQSGDCHVKGKRCSPTSAADCQASERCQKNKNYCSYDPNAQGGQGECVN